MTNFNRVVLSLTALLIVVPTLWAETVTISPPGGPSQRTNRWLNSQSRITHLALCCRTSASTSVRQKELDPAREWIAEITGESLLSIKTVIFEQRGFSNSTQTSCEYRAHRQNQYRPVKRPHLHNG